MTDGTAARPFLNITKMTVDAGRLRVDVHLTPRCPRRTDAHLARMATERFPALPWHTCINHRGPTFASVLEDTPLPHLLEHLIIDRQTADARTAPQQRFVGTTRWTDAQQRCAHVEVNFYDDLVALQATKEALAALNDMLAGYANAHGEEGNVDDSSS